MSVVTVFQKNHNIASDKILVGEFDGHRKLLGLEKIF